MDILWASLECTNYSNAKGGKPRDADSRTLAWELPRYALHCDPDYILIENVREFLGWGPLDENGRPVNKKKGKDFWKWIQHMKKIGWENVEWRILNAADYGSNTRRERLFIIFTKEHLSIKWMEATHHPEANNLFGLPKWRAAKEHIDLENVGKSIFGRKKPLSKNTLRRIAGGIRKFYADMYFVMKYYGNGDNVSSINEPLHTIRTKDCHVLVKVEKKQFITDHCWLDYQQKVTDPLSTQLTRQTKQLITVEKKHFIAEQYNSGGKPESQVKNIKRPLGTITTSNKHQLVTVEKKQFIAEQYSSNGKPESNVKSINKPLGVITTEPKHQFITVEKKQFIAEVYNSKGKPEANTKSIDKPLGTITCKDKHQFITVEKGAGSFDFDVKMRFLTPEELAAITGFPSGYFDKTKLTKKDQIKMIGNAVPVGLAKAVIEPITEELQLSRQKRMYA